VRAALLIALLGCAHGPRSVVLPTLSGEKVRLADLRGRVVLLDFWATWCEPCKLSLPFYARLQRELRGLEVVAASTDEDDEDVRKFLAQTPLPYTIARDPAGRIADELGVELMPTTFLLDRAGNVRFRHVGAAPDSEAALRREVQQLLAE
jgi:cytochrome c biogenesis protein CcmG/thiol:disulfide interchange protein DsbE